MKRTYETMCGMSPRIHELHIDGPLYKYCQENRPDGIISAGYLGIAIWTVDGSGDEVIAAWGHENGYTGAARHCINYSSAGRAYINKGRCRWYLDEALRTVA